MEKIMKKIIMLAGLICTLVACSDKPVSKDYYASHLSEAKEKRTQCSNNKDENAISCQNAIEAMQAAAWAAEQKKTSAVIRF